MAYGQQQYAPSPPQQEGAPPQQQEGAPPPPPDYDSQGPDSQGPDSQGPEQAEDQPPPVNYQALDPEQLGQLVAPIALYPDSLVAQILAASTYPAQVASAGQFINQNGNYPPEQLAEQANTQPWDPSVKSLVAFPQVVNDLNSNMQWTTQLGNAYYNQPQDVMSAVQAMRQRAYAAGHLRSTPQLGVTYAPDDIAIAPVSESVVYVPYYNPWEVYGAPVPVYAGYRWERPHGVAFAAGLGIGFGVGIAIGAFSHYSWGYHRWAPNWRSRTVVFNRATYISRSHTVVNHGYYGRFDRHPEARSYNRAQAARFGGNNHTTINNIHINRGGNTFNRGRTSYNHGSATYNRGANTYNHSGNTFNHQNHTVNRGGTSYNHGSQTHTYQQSNHGGQSSHGGGHASHGGGGHESHGGGHDGGHDGGHHH